MEVQVLFRSRHQSRNHCHYIPVGLTARYIFLLNLAFCCTSKTRIFLQVRSASFILLQGVPHTVSIEDVRASILCIEGVLSLHDLHVWQLSENKIVASVHVITSQKHDFMRVASDIRKVLHYHGIHSSTIQPEYPPRQTSSEEHLTTSPEESCLIVCPRDQKCDPSENSCCRAYHRLYNVVHF